MRTDRVSPRRVAEFCLAALLPADCLLCGAPLPWSQRGSVCLPCWNRIPWSPGLRPRADVLRAILWGADYDGAIRDLIHAFKFAGLDYLGAPLGEHLALRIAPLFGTAIPRPDLIVPVPLHWWRSMRRGFNQAHLLAAAIARVTGLPLRPRLLLRCRAGRRQLGSSRHERLRSLDACFEVPRGLTRRRPRAELEGRRILLVDDVLTTGATLLACARILHRAGARSVVGCVLARTPVSRGAASPTRPHAIPGQAPSRDQ